MLPIIQMGKSKSKEDIILMRSALMRLKSFKSRLENGEDGMKMGRKNMLNILTKKVKTMGSLFIGMKMELRPGNGIIKMEKNTALLKYGFEMVKNLRRQRILKGKKRVLLVSGMKMEIEKWKRLLRKV